MPDVAAAAAAAETLQPQTVAAALCGHLSSPYWHLNLNPARQHASTRARQPAAAGEQPEGALAAWTARGNGAHVRETIGSRKRAALRRSGAALAGPPLPPVGATYGGHPTDQLLPHLLLAELAC